MQPVTISQALAAAYSTINKIDAILLLQHVLIVNHAFLLTYPDQILTGQQFEKFSSLVQQRIEGLPVAYLIGERAFFDLTLKVTEAVLIPRPETELLVEWALKLIPFDKFCNVLDLGTGSGAIAISIAKHRPQTQVVAVDLSPAAVDVCRRNADILKVANLNAINGNWFDELSGENFDLIVSNPPYVAEDDPHLLQGDLRFEPRIALSAGEHGMACITHIINAAPNYLSKDGWLLLEHGYDQAEACRKLLRGMDFCNIFSYPDLAGIMRVSGGQLNLSI
ncbi:MAG: peptide chain release factor N(5)-glutamine methyltransferase [Nitrosomonas sp.]|uniref:peptide chain release factor N(5)-glutamine methyltransferase n=1 Tax=Nitrosomonas sp. TaxID=42353 RepID=UPI0025CF4C80|nr:peptide chain release factor N(5)-glutamine methyltransferase [Nitrosomonas sp.]MBY0475873.1 peptide chain release factor N(5)-glutamine methyltransferase [Nitrosomonas sp.]